MAERTAEPQGRGGTSDQVPHDDVRTEPPDGAADKRAWSDFRKLWTAQTVSVFGSEVSELALPLAAVLVLDASPGQVGLLGTARFAPFLMVSAFAGVWLDRHRRRPVMIGADLIRAGLLAAVVVAAFTGTLAMWHLYVTGFAIGTMTVLFDTAYLSYVPSLLSGPRLVAGNSRLGMSSSAAEVGGQGIGGGLVQLLTAPGALAVDAASYVLSAAALARIHAPEPPPDVQRVGAESRRPSSRGAAVGQLRRDVAEGLGVVLRDPRLRALVGEAGTFNFFEQAFVTVFLVYAVRELQLGAGVLGTLIGVGSVGALLGAAAAPRAAEWLGLGRSLLIAMAVGNTAPLLVLAVPAGGLTGLGVAILTVSFLVKGFGVGLSVVHTVSLRQTVTPPGLLSRMHASYRLLSYGPLPLGAALGGLLAERIGLRGALVVAVLGLPLATLWVALSPVPRLRTLPDPPAPPDSAQDARTAGT